MIIVFGSINMDINLGVGKLPEPGETIMSLSYDMTAGGKGANQALAAARSGIKTALVGKVGDDGMGNRILNSLRRNEVMTSGTGRSEKLPTGIAFVAKDRKGQNQIVIASGANAEASAAQVPDDILKDSNVVLLQMELNKLENIIVMEQAKMNGAKVILNLAPAIKISRKELSLVNYLVVNEVEAAQLSGVAGLKTEKDAIKIAQALAVEGDLNCIITLGQRGVVAVTQQGKGWTIPAMILEEVADTTGAGDCFCGTLAACLHEDMPLPDAIKRASIAAGLSCQKHGIHESYPYSGNVEDNLDKLPDPQPVTLE